MPHESTVAHEQSFVVENPTFVRFRNFNQVKDSSSGESDEQRNHSSWDAEQQDSDSPDCPNDVNKNGGYLKVCRSICITIELLKETIL